MIIRTYPDLVKSIFGSNTNKFGPKMLKLVGGELKAKPGTAACKAAGQARMKRQIATTSPSLFSDHFRLMSKFAEPAVTSSVRPEVVVVWYFSGTALAVTITTYFPGGNDCGKT